MAKDHVTPGKYRSDEEDVMNIRVNALGVEEIGDGKFLLSFRARRLNEDEHSLLRRLFPLLSEQAYRLLTQEALLASIEQ